MTPTNACLDAETLAAWVDGGLSRNDAAMAEAHVSSCPRCQAIAGLIVKTAPVTPAGAPWWRARAPWLIPITAGVVAAGLLMIAPADSPTPAALTPGPAVATPTAGPPAATAKGRAGAERRASRGSAGPRCSGGCSPRLRRSRHPRSRRKERQRDERKNAAADTAVPAAPAPPAAVSGRVAAEQTARQEFAAAAAKDAVSPDGALRWRITDRGALERSTDGGTTWQAVNVGTTATFTTVEAPEPRTAIVTTTDGRRFRTTDAGATWLPVQE